MTISSMDFLDRTMHPMDMPMMAQESTLVPVSLKRGMTSVTDFVISNGSYDKGKMDGWDLRLTTVGSDAVIPLNAAQYPEYGYVPHNESRPYFEMARRYVLADHMFQSNMDQSFRSSSLFSGGAVGRLRKRSRRSALGLRRDDRDQRAYSFNVPTSGTTRVSLLRFSLPWLMNWRDAIFPGVTMHRKSFPPRFGSAFFQRDGESFAQGRGPISVKCGRHSTQSPTYDTDLRGRLTLFHPKRSCSMTSGATFWRM